MAGKALNKKNLTALGAETLAELLLEAVKGDAARQRRVRMALSSTQSPSETAADIRKRLAQIRRAKSWISARAQRTLAKELTGLVELIEANIAPQDAGLAFDLIWALLQLAPDIHDRTDDSSGAITGAMETAMAALRGLAPRVTRDPQELAEQVFDALMDNGYGAFDGVIPALSEALGPAGLAALKTRADDALDAPLDPDNSHDFKDMPSVAHWQFMAQSRRSRALRAILSDVADATGDVDAWLSQYSAAQLTYHTIAPDAARRLLDAGRAEDALRMIEACIAAADDPERSYDMPEVDSAHFACLETLGLEDALRRAMWTRFEQQLCAETLRRYLSRLPDFDDEEAHWAARAHVRNFADLNRALYFCLSWPDPALAAEIVLSSPAELDGNDYEILTAAAELLQAEHPLAATLVWRAMISFALQQSRVKRYRHAARHLASCAQADVAITDYGAFPDHVSYVAALRRKHPRTQAFWSKVYD